MKGTKAKDWGHLEGKGNISMKVIPLNSKHSWDSKQPDSFLKKKKKNKEMSGQEA